MQRYISAQYFSKKNFDKHLNYYKKWSDSLLNTYRSIDRAISMFNDYGFVYELKDCFSGYFHVWDLDGNFYKYWSENKKGDEF